MKLTSKKHWAWAAELASLINVNQCRFFQILPPKALSLKLSCFEDRIESLQAQRPLKTVLTLSQCDLETRSRSLCGNQAGCAVTEILNC